jgi:hypothetical protein
MKYLEDPFVVRGRDRFALGADTARVSGARTRAIVKVLSAWARREPSILEATRPPGPAAEGTLAEVEGASRALGMSADDLLAARRIMESLAMPGCTNFGAVGTATEDGSVMTSWNFDVAPFFRLMMGRFPLFVREVPGTIPYLAMGIPALFGIGVMNAEGLSCVVNAVGLTDDGDGLTPFELNNQAMETCSRVSEASRVFEEGPRQALKAITMGILMNWNTIWADREGNLSLFECSHNYFNEQDATAQASIASANHHQFLDHALSGGTDPATQPLMAGSFSRLGRMYALLEEHRGQINPRVVKQMVSDHMADYSLLADYGIEREWWEEKMDDSTVCAHAWNLRKHLAAGRLGAAWDEVSFSSTVYSFQFQPLCMTSWFTDGHPCKNDAIPVYWGRLLGSEVDRYPGALDPDELFGAKRQTTRRLIFSESAGGAEGVLGRAWMAMSRLGERPNFK